MSHSPVPINWAKLWLGVAENSFSAQRSLKRAHKKSSQKILTRKSLALEWQIWVQPIEPNHSQQSNTLQCLHNLTYGEWKMWDKTLWRIGFPVQHNFKTKLSMGIVWIAKSSYNCYWGKGSLRWYYLLFLKRGENLRSNRGHSVAAVLGCSACGCGTVFSYSLPARITQYQSKSSAFSLPISTHVWLVWFSITGKRVWGYVASL